MKLKSVKLGNIRDMFPKTGTEKPAPRMPGKTQLLHIFFSNSTATS